LTFAAAHLDRCERCRLFEAQLLGLVLTVRSIVAEGHPPASSPRVIERSSTGHRQSGTSLAKGGAMNRIHRINRFTLMALVGAAVVAASALAGAESPGPSTQPSEYASESLYVFSSSGKKMGILTGDGLNTQFVTSSGLRAR
jgi:hypothetical protein